MLYQMGLPIVLATIALGVSLYYYVNRKKSLQSIEKFRAVCDQLDYANQSAEVKQDGGLVRVSKFAESSGKDMKYVSTFFSDCKTLYDVLPRGSRQSSKLTLLLLGWIIIIIIIIFSQMMVPA